jgi:hypothetical protein
MPFAECHEMRGGRSREPPALLPARRTMRRRGSAAVYGED